MAYDKALADQVRATLASADVVAVEQSMFGGLAFMAGGHMTVGVLGDDLLVRVGHDGYAAALAQPAARAMDFTGRPMKTMVLVATAELDDAALESWIRRGLDFTRSLPPK